MRRNEHGREILNAEGIVGMIPVEKMPEDVWFRYAWMRSVDPEVWSGTRVLGVGQGVLRLACQTVEAAHKLEDRAGIIKKFRQMGCLRALPYVNQIEVVYGNLIASNAPKETPSLDEARVARLTEILGDREQAEQLARLVPDDCLEHW